MLFFCLSFAAPPRRAINSKRYIALLLSCGEQRTNGPIEPQITTTPAAATAAEVAPARESDVIRDSEKEKKIFEVTKGVKNRRMDLTPWNIHFFFSL